MADTSFADPDMTTFARLDGLGLRVVGQFIEPDRAILQCRVVDADQRCRCGELGRPRDARTPRLAHEPLSWRPTLLRATVRRYRCGSCGYVWRQDAAAQVGLLEPEGQGIFRAGETSRAATISPGGRTVPVSGSDRTTTGPRP